MVTKRRDIDHFSTFSGRCHYTWKVLLGRNDRAVLASIVLYFFGLARHNFTKKDPPGVSFSAIFSDSLNVKRHRVFPLSGSLNFDDIGFRQNDAPQAYAIPVKLVKNNWGTRQKWWGKWNHNDRRVGSMSLLNMALVCFRVWVGTSHLDFHWPPWVWVILFWPLICSLPCHHDLWSLDVKYCQIRCRAADMFKRSWPLQDINLPLLSQIILIHSILCLSRVDDVGNIMAHLRSRSLPVDFSSLSRKLI